MVNTAQERDSAIEELKKMKKELLKKDRAREQVFTLNLSLDLIFFVKNNYKTLITIIIITIIKHLCM